MAGFLPMSTHTRAHTAGCWRTCGSQEQRCPPQRAASHWPGKQGIQASAGSGCWAKGGTSEAVIAMHRCVHDTTHRQVLVRSGQGSHVTPTACTALCAIHAHSRRSASTKLEHTLTFQLGVQTEWVCQHDDKVASSMSVCKGCLLARYCSPACQRADWKAHKTSCRRTGAA